MRGAIAVKCAVALLTAFVVLAFLIALKFAPISPDAGYTLPMARFLADGHTLFKDIRPTHTSAVLFVHSFLFHLCGPDLNYASHLLVVFVCELISAVWVYLISRYFTCPRYLAILVAMTYLLSCYSSEGIYHEYEPYVTAFAGGAVWCYLSHSGVRSKVLTGLLLGLSICFKQYAVLYLAALMLNECLVYKNLSLFLKARNIALLAFSASVAPLMYYAFLFLPADIGLKEFVSTLVISQYGWHPSGFYEFTYNLFLIQPFLIFAFFLNRSEYETHRKDGTTLLLLTTFAAIPGFVRQHPHYFLLILPFSSMLLGLLVSRINVMRRPCSCFLWMGLLSSLLPSYVLASNFWHFRPRGEQLAFAEKINEMIPSNSPVMVIGDQSLVYICNFAPPSPLGVGYNFLTVMNVGQIAESMKSAKYLIQYESNYQQAILLYLRQAFDFAGLNLDYEIESHFGRPTQISVGNSSATILKRAD